MTDSVDPLPRPPLRDQRESDQWLAEIMKLNDGAFVEQAFEFVLQRGTDPSGEAAYKALLADGWSKWFLLRLLLQSDEAISRGVQRPRLQALLTRYEQAQGPSMRARCLRALWGIDSDAAIDRQRRAQQSALAQATLIPEGLAGAPAQLLEREFSHAVSLGTICHTAHVLRKLRLRAFSSPFDWLFSTPEIVVHALNDGFKTLLDPTQFEPVPRKHRPDPNACLCDHRFYRDVFGQSFMFNHHLPTKPEDAAYLSRCVARLMASLQGTDAVLGVMLVSDTMPAHRIEPLVAALGRLGQHFVLVIQLRPHPSAAGLPPSKRTIWLACSPDFASVQLLVSGPSVGTHFTDVADNEALEILLNQFKVVRHTAQHIQEGAARWWQS